MVEAKRLKAKQFEEDLIINPWKASEMLKLNDDLLNIAMLKRKAGASVLNRKFDRARGNRNAYEKKRKKQKGKGT